MNQKLKACKPILREFMRTQYSDERLSWLLAHARDGNLFYNSCCCFIGVPTADHALQGLNMNGKGIPAVSVKHYFDASRLPHAFEAERAFLDLDSGPPYCATDEVANHQRRLRLIPMIRAEQKRRERLHEPLPENPSDATLAYWANNSDLFVR